MTPAEDLPRSSRILAILMLALVAYWPTLRVGFLWDDHVMIEENPYIRSWSSGNLRHDFSATVSNGYGDAGYLRPVVTWSNRLDYSIWKLRPSGCHATSLALHMGNTLLLDELVLALGCAPMAALLSASLFAVHPIGVEGLLCVTGRATFLSFFFCMTTLLLMLKPTRTRVLLGFLSFGAALFSKEESVVIPFLLALVWIVRGEKIKRFALLTPLLAMLGAYLLYRHHLFGALGAPPDHLFTLCFLAQAFPRVLTHYVKLLLVPWNLHSHRLILRMSHLWLPSLIGWTGLVLVSWLKRKDHPLLFFCVIWLVTGLLPPALAMVHGGFMLDHWGYWIAPAVLLPLGILFDRLWARRSQLLSGKLAFLYFPLVIGYALLTRLNIELRNTDEKMYRWALHFTTSHPIQYNLGVVLLESGRAQEAIPYFIDARNTYPDDLKNWHALALAYWRAGHHKLGIRMLEDLLQEHPDFQPAIQSLQVMKSRP